MLKIVKTIGDERGYMLVMALMIMTILTVLATAATHVSITERESAASEEINELTFYAAEAGRFYVPERPDLYHEQNITVGNSLSFPDPADSSAQYEVGGLASFNGSVEYIGRSSPPRGSGFDVGKFKAHRYRITSVGYCPKKSSEGKVEAAFYRIGF